MSALSGTVSCAMVCIASLNSSADVTVACVPLSQMLQGGRSQFQHSFPPECTPPHRFSLAAGATKER